ncbi:hypothetical protein V6N13_099720 [Hibiscus sabdariffa]
MQDRDCGSMSTCKGSLDAHLLSSAMFFPPLLFHTVMCLFTSTSSCQVPPRVPPNTSVGHQGPPFSPGSKRIRHHNPSEVVKGTPEDN